MNVGRAIAAGVIGAVIVYLIVYVAGSLSGTDADLCLLSGASLTGSAGALSWLFGAIGQLVIAVIATLVYAAIFEWVTRRAGAVVGFLVAIGHVVIAGIGIGFLPAQSLVHADLWPPGAFMEYRGLVVLIGFIIAHLVFGTLVGAMYGRVHHAIGSERVVWRDVTSQT